MRIINEEVLFNRYSLFLWATLSLNIQYLNAQEIEKTQNIKEIVVFGNNSQTDNLILPQTGIKSFSSEDISKATSLLSEPDVLRLIQTEPGVSGGIEGFSGMFVRGGEDDANLYLLHHLPLYHVSHLGGLISSFNTAVLDKAKFFKSGFPAQYGGKTSSITDITIREGNYTEYHGQASIGLLSGNVYATGPIIKDRLAFTAGIRRSWSELITIPLLAIINHSQKSEGEKTTGGYNFSDMNLKIDYRIHNQCNGYTHFYHSGDNIRYGQEKQSFPGEDFYNEESLLGLRYGTTGIATGLNYTINATLSLSVNGYYSHFKSQIYQDNDENAKNEYTYYHKKNDTGINDAGFTLHGNYAPTGKVIIKWGIDYTHHKYTPEHLAIESSMKNHTFMPDNPSVVHANEVSLWNDHTLSLSDRLSINVGLRWSGYSSEGRTIRHLEPRTNIRLTLCNNLSMKASYMRAYQYAQRVTSSFINLPTDCWHPIGAIWKPLESDHISLGLYGNLPHHCYFSIEGYYKWMHHLMEYKDGVDEFSPNADWNMKLTAGDGWAYGSDISIHREEGKLTGNISYGLLWNTRRFEELNNGHSFPAKYDNRHKLNINGHYRLSKNMGIHLAWTYMTGNRMTLALQNFKKLDNSGFTYEIAPLGVGGEKWGVGYFPSRNNIRLPSYHRLDLGITLYRYYKKDCQGIWNFNIYNVYSRMNPVAVTKSGIENLYGGEIQWFTKFQTLGLLPIIPSISYTLKL